MRGRDVISLLKTLPGVSYLSAAESESLGSRFGTDTPNISGTRKEWNTVTVDDVVELMMPRGWKKRSLRSIAR